MAYAENLVLLLLAILAAIVSAEPNDTQTRVQSLTVVKQEIDLLLADTETNFKRNIDDLFWIRQKAADEFLDNRRNIPGCALKTLSNWAATIENTKYALRRKALQSVKDWIFENTAHIKILRLTSSKSLDFNADLAHLLVSRANLRALTDGLLTDSWRNMYWYIETYIFEEPKDEPLEDEVNIVAKRVHQERRRYHESTHEAYTDFNSQLESFCKEMNMVGENKSLQKALDLLIDELVGCLECSRADEPDPKAYNTYPLFSSREKQVELTKTSVDPSLLDAINKSAQTCEGKVADFGRQMLEIVGYEDILDQEQDLDNRQSS